MDIESISHKALKRFFLTGNSKGLVGDVERLRAMLAFIAAAASLDELASPPNYGLHYNPNGHRGRYEFGGLSWLLKCTPQSPFMRGVG
jgi:toxin HigB-1